MESTVNMNQNLIPITYKIRELRVRISGRFIGAGVGAGAGVGRDPSSVDFHSCQ